MDATKNKLTFEDKQRLGKILDNSSFEKTLTQKEKKQNMSDNRPLLSAHEKKKHYRLFFLEIQIHSVI